MPAAAIPTLHPSLRRGDFSQAPFLVIWEVTRACDLACKHCRASSQAHRDPGELSTAEGKRLLDDVRAEFGPVLVILTGGDPCKRDDLEDLIAHGAGLGLRMALSPSATPLLTRDRIRSIAAAGACRMSLSLDGADAATHDAFRGVDGTFDRTMDALRWVPEAGCEVQINSTIHPGNVHQLRDLARIGTDAGITLWSVFFLVPTGRGRDVDLLTAGWHEQAWRELADVALDPATPFDIKTTAGQPFYRVLSQEATRRGYAGNLRKGLRSPAGVNDGNGICFVSWEGDIRPSGFLTLTCGNVRRESIASVYRGGPTFRALRDPDNFHGKCGHCEFKRICGGSRSRTFAMTGDPLAADPTCVYQPRTPA